MDSDGLARNLGFDDRRLELMERLLELQYEVERFAPPRVRGERVLIARYGKLLFMSQRLLRCGDRIFPSDPPPDNGAADHPSI